MSIVNANKHQLQAKELTTKTMTIYTESDMYRVAITMEIGVNETQRIS